MELVSGEFSQDEWARIADGFLDLDLMQTWEYATARSRTGAWRVERAVFDEGGRVVGAVQALLRPVPVLGGGLVWINRAPLWRRTATEGVGRLMAMLGALRQHWVGVRRMYLRVAPPTLEGGLDAAAMESLGYRRDSAGWASAVLDLSRPEEDLRGRLSGDWHRQLARAERAGVRCVSGTSAELFEEFLDDFRRLSKTRPLSRSVTPELVRELQRLLPEERSMWVFAGRRGEERLGSLLVCVYGTTGMFLASAVNELGRKVHAGHAVHWEAILRIRRMGYARFDVGGADPDLTPPGILQFKAGLGATPYRLAGEWEAWSGGLSDRVTRLLVRWSRRL